MANPAELYVRGIKAKLADYYAAWLPNEVVELGDVGVLTGGGWIGRGYLFHKETNLKDLGISFAETPPTGSTSIDLVSGTGVSVSFKAAGDSNDTWPGIPKAQAGVSVEFGLAGAFVLKAADSRLHSIDNLNKVGSDFLKAFNEGKCHSDWVVVVGVVKTEAASIFVSESDASKIELAADATVKTGTVTLGDGKVGFTVKQQSGDMVSFPDAKNVTPLFQLATIKTHIFGPNTFGVRDFGVKPSPLTLSSVTPARLKTDKALRDSLYFDLVRDSELEPR